MNIANCAYYCPCGTGGSDDRLPRLSPQSLHELPDLYLCPQCHVIRCKFCASVTIEAKFCAGCMTNFSDKDGLVRCAKNCFECPMCNSPVVVTANDRKMGNLDQIDSKILALPLKTGKQFCFRCVTCDFTYQTQVVTKPAPLSSILKNEVLAQFRALTIHFSELNSLHNQRPLRPVLTSENAELMRSLSSLKVGASLQGHVVTLENVHVPLGKQLSAKRKFSCADCNAELLVPVPEPRTLKILRSSYAVDHVPTINITTRGRKLSPGTETPCWLCVLNPGARSINVNLAIVAENPHAGPGVDVSMFLSETSFSVQARRGRADGLESVPTVLLTNNTRAARAEALKRALVSEKMEVGANWVSVPLTVSLLEDSAVPERLKVPLYCLVESLMPEGWASDRRGLRYGFWVLVTVQQD